jgi:DNA transposition AAA+ family ATPase
MTTSTVSFSIEDASIMKKIKQHLSTCDCCRKAIAEGTNDK